MTDHYFVSAIDGDKRALVLGPFTDEKTCRQYAYRPGEDGGSEKFYAMHDAVIRLDRSAHFAAFGMVRIPLAEMCPFNYRGFLNRYEPDIWNKVIS